MTAHRRRCRFSLWENEEGFTLVEVLVAMALLGTLSLVVWAASFIGGRTLEKISSGIRHNIELLEIDSTARSYARRIVTPYWLSAPKTGSSDGELSISWLDGSPDKSLTLSLRGGRLTFDDGSQAVSFPDVQESRMEVAAPAQGSAPALFLTVRLTGSAPVTIIASLGGVPFPLVGQQ